MAREHSVRRSFRIAVLGGVAALALYPTAASAQEARTSEVNIKAQNLGDALTQAGRQTRTEIIFSPSAVAGKTAPAVQGHLSAQETVARLLAGSGLFARQTKSGAFVVEGTPQGNAPAGGPDAGRKNPLSSLGEETTPPNAAAAPESSQVSAITVIGTRLKGVPKDGPQEIRSYSHEQIEASGEPSIARFLNTLPEVSQMSSGTSLGNPGSTNSIQLRGFPVGTTLVLLDGHRAPNSGFSGNAFDINNIPEGLLKRVDILPLGSSAIYGSDALAGVVNLVLNRDLKGFSVDGSYGQALHYSDRSATISAGRKFARGDLGFGISYEDHGALTVADRKFLASGDFSRFAALGGFDQRRTFCQPGTVFALSGNLPGLGAPFAAIPAGLTGRPSISDFAPGANKQNLCNPLATTALIPQTTRWSGLIYGDFDVTDHLHLYATGLIGHLQNIVPFAGQIASSIVGASNPFNPFGMPVRVTSALPIKLTNRDTTQFQHFELGLRADLGGGWTSDLHGNSTEDRDKLISPGHIFFPALNAALASTDPAAAINLFSSDIPSSVASNVVRTLTSHFGDRSRIAEIVLRGPLFRLPGGPVELATGGSHEEQHFTSDAIGGIGLTGNVFETTSFGSRHVTSAFSELRAPLLASFQSGEKPALALSAAMRHDQFSDFGSATTPQFGLEFRPWSSLLFRATSSKAFRAPTLFALNRSQQVIVGQIRDPKHGGAFVLVPETFGGNPNLRPETGHSSSLGVVWTPEHTGTASLSITYWKISEHNRVTNPNAQALVDNELEFPGRVVRDATGNLVSIDATFINFGDIRAEGIDFDATDRIETRFGELTPSLSLTLTTKFRAAFQPGSPLQDRLGRPVFGDAWAPRLKANATVGWHHGPLSASVIARYLGRYHDYQLLGPNSNRLGGYALWDASANVSLGDLLGLTTPGLKRTELSVTAVNLFDRGPQFSNSSIGFDPQEFDILGRFVNVRLRLSW